jgi:hypothetical protein
MNPEFQRNVWLELTPHRVVSMPAVLVAVFFLVYLIAGDRYPDPLRITAMTIFFLLTLLWGSRLAGEALVNEVQDRTWDQQRMSSISPWSMSWGKLFGSTVFTWYGAAICLLAYFIAAIQSGEQEIIKTVLFMVFVSVFGQSIALLSSLQTVKSYHRSASTAFMVAGIIVSIPLISWAFQDIGTIQWYGTDYRPLNFLLVSVICFTAWSLLGIHRRIREELQFRNTPVYWFAFCIFVSFYLAGLVPARILGDEVTTVRLVVAYVTFISLAYLMVITEVKDPVLVRRIIAAVKARNWQSIFENTPAWLVTLAGVYVLCLVLLLHSSSLTHFLPQTVETKPVAAAVALFLTRDILLFIFFNMSANRRRADVTAIFYLLLLYWLIPSILNGLGMTSLNALLLPMGPHNEMVSIVAGAVQVGVLMYLSVRRWKQLYVKNPQAPMKIQGS